MKFFKVFANDIAIDLGTANTSVYVAKKGIVLKEATAVAMEVKTGQIIGFGNEAIDMLGKTPDNIVVLRPLEDGIISDFDLTKIFLDFCINKSLKGLSLVPPRILITVPAGISDIEFRAIEDACIHSGAREVYIVEAVMVGSIGLGAGPKDKSGRMIIDFGAGNVQIAVVSMNGVVLSKTLNFGGDLLNSSIIDYILDKYSIIIGEATAENLKKTIGNVGKLDQNDAMEVSGRDLLTGMPVSVDVFASDVREAIIDHIYEILDAVRSILEKNPPELSSDILRNGISLTGGSSQLKGFRELLEAEFDIAVNLSTTPYDDIIRGAGMMVENLETYKNYGK